VPFPAAWYVKVTRLRKRIADSSVAKFSPISLAAALRASGKCTSTGAICEAGRGNSVGVSG
jgi:hypothetical protein